jgi:hypothetical protein
MTNSLFDRAEQAIDRAYALLAERQHLKGAAERLLDRNHEITQRLAIENRMAVAHRRGPK